MTNLYGTITPFWGDMFVCLGHFIQKIPSGKALFLGSDISMLEFLQHQLFIQHIQMIPDREHPFWYYRNHIPEFMEYISTTSGISAEQITPTHFCDLYSSQPPAFIPPLTLPDYYLTQAKTIFEKYSLIENNTFLVFPYSLNSASVSDHSPFWECILQWISTQLKHRFIVCGKDVPYEAVEKHLQPHVVNLINKTDSMLDIFALASLSRGVITTANGLSYWCSINKIPSVIIYNKLIQEYSLIFDYFHKLYSPVRVEYNKSLSHCMVKIYKLINQV